MTQKLICGVDLHTSTFDACIMTKQKEIVKRFKMSTSEKNLIKLAKIVGKRGEIVFEEGTLAGWVNEVLIGKVSKVVIADPKENKWIYKSAQKNDKIDAKKLCELYIGGYVKEVYHPIGEYREYRELVQFYHKIVKEIVRYKNQLKAKFRGNGIRVNSSVYGRKYEDNWRDKLPNNTFRLQADSLHKMIEYLTLEKRMIRKRLRKLSNKYAIVRLLEEIPGVGLITAMTFVGILVTPYRFSNKRKLWTYGGFGLCEKESGGKSSHRHLNKKCNRLLKKVIKTATEDIVKPSAKDSRLKKKYHELLWQGIKTSSAKLTVARKLMVSMWMMWQTGECYNEKAS